MESAAIHPLSTQHPIDIVNSVRDQLCILLNLFDHEDADACGENIELTSKQADAYYFFVENLENYLSFAMDKLEGYRPSSGLQR